MSILFIKLVDDSYEASMNIHSGITSEVSEKMILRKKRIM